ncbi:MAG: hypothetical protein JNK14_21215 [Chitinophagaceae bacterium]|nr:hypothetical protein [Chitinophagaceae bacterium]
MKQVTIILFLTCSWFLSVAQMEVLKENSWTIKWNKKVLLTATSENESANTRKLKKTELSKKYFLEINYKEADPVKAKEWKRSFLFFGDTENELLRKDSTQSVKIAAAELKKLFGKQKKIRIYTLSIPTDPDLAARVRVRRVHVCTLMLY